MKIDINNIIGLGAIGAIALTGYSFYQHRQTEKQMMLDQMVIEHRLALLERNQHLQFKQLSESTKYTKQIAKDMRLLKQERYRELNHRRIVKTLNGIPKVNTYRVRPMQLSASERRCLEKNVFHEAAYEPTSGMLAVAQVSGNRVKSKHRGTNFCEVIYADAQFSWTLDKKAVKMNPSGPEWVKAKRVVDMYINGYRIRGLEEAEFYFARYIKQPSWARDMKYVHYIGEHMFLNHRS